MRLSSFCCRGLWALCVVNMIRWRRHLCLHRNSMLHPQQTKSSWLCQLGHGSTKSVNYADAWDLSYQ